MEVIGRFPIRMLIDPFVQAVIEVFADNGTILPALDEVVIRIVLKMDIGDADNVTFIITVMRMAPCGRP